MMLTFWGMVTVLTLGGGLPAVGGLWAFERWRSKRRNRTGRCAACGGAWRQVSGDPFLIHGRLVCEACAERARRRMPWHFGALGLAAGVATGLSLAGAHAAAVVLMPGVTTVVMTAGAIQLMKLANRRAERRIAGGEFPAMKALATGPTGPS